MTTCVPYFDDCTILIVRRPFFISPAGVQGTVINRIFRVHEDGSNSGDNHFLIRQWWCSTGIVAVYTGPRVRDLFSVLNWEAFRSGDSLGSSLSTAPVLMSRVGLQSGLLFPVISLGSLRDSQMCDLSWSRLFRRVTWVTARVKIVLSKQRCLKFHNLG